MVDNKRIIEEIKSATKASEEDIKAMLQLHEGDANAAMLALLETPFQKVDGKKHHKTASSGRQDPGSRERASSGRRDSYPASSGRGGGRGSGRGDGRPLGARGGGPGPSGRGRGQGASSSRETSSSIPANDNGYHPDATTVVEPAGSGYDATTSSTTQPSPVHAGGAWGPQLTSNAAAVAPAGAWGAGNKTMAERIKAKQAPAPPPVYEAPAESEVVPDVEYDSYPAGEYAEDGETAYETVPEPEIIAAPEPEVEAVEAQVEEPAAPQPAYQWSNADAAKNLLNSLTKGSSTAAAPVPASQQPAQHLVQSQHTLVPPAQDQTLSTADNALPASAHYGAYGAAGANAPASIPTAAEIEAQALQLSVNFGNFGLGDFGGNFSSGYAPLQPDAGPGLVPKQAAAEQAPAPPAQDIYNGYNPYNNSDKMGGQAQPHPPAAPVQQADTSRPTSTNAPNTFSSFGQGSGFGAAFGSNFAAPNPDPAYDAAQQAFANYGQDPVKQASYANAAPGMNAYNMQQYQQQPQQQPTASAYHQSGVSKSMYAPYSQQAPQPASASTPEPAAASSNAINPAAAAASAGPSGGMPTAPGGVPHQMHFANQQAAGAQGLAQYNTAALYNTPYPQFNPPYMGYNYNMGYGYQGVGAYPPQPASAYPPNTAGYTVPHTQHTGPRTQHSYNPYSNPAQGVAPGSQGAPAGYGAAGQPAAYGLTGYEDMAASAASAAPGNYGAGKDKDANIYGGQQGAYQNQPMRGGNYGGYGNQGYSSQGSYGQQPKGNYGGGYNRQQQQQQYNNAQQQYNNPQQQYGGSGGYNKGGL